MPQAEQVPISCEVSPPSILTESRQHTTQPNGELLHPHSDDREAPYFRCNYKDISRNLNEAKLMQFSSNPSVGRKGYFKLTVEHLPPLNVEEGTFSQPGKGHCTNFSCQPDPRGYVTVTKTRNREVSIPSFPLPDSQRKSWSQKSLKEFWEGALKESLQDVFYVIGDPLFQDIELSPGEGMKRIDGSRSSVELERYTSISALGCPSRSCTGRMPNFAR